MISIVKSNSNFRNVNRFELKIINVFLTTFLYSLDLILAGITFFSACESMMIKVAPEHFFLPVDVLENAIYDV